MPKWVVSTAGIVVPIGMMLGLWELAALTDAFGPSWPNIRSVAAALPSVADSGVTPILKTFRGAILALLVGISAGIAIGLTVGVLYHWLRGVYYLLTGLRAIPVTVLIPIALVVFGIRGFLTPLIALAVTLLVATDLAQSVRQASHQRFTLVRSWGFGNWFYVRHILIHEVFGAVVSNLRISLPMALALHVALDYFLSAGGGIGREIERLYRTNRLPEMYAHIVIFSAVAVIFVVAVDYLAGRILAWRQEI